MEDYMEGMTGEQANSWLATATSFHAESPIIANTIILLSTATPIAIAFFRYLNKRQALQISENAHIRDHEYRMKQGGLK